jgi:hypothetical protein
MQRAHGRIGDSGRDFHADELGRGKVILCEMVKDRDTDHCSLQPIRNIALRVALDLDVYNTLSSDNESPKSAAQLAELKGADPVLVGESDLPSHIHLSKYDVAISRRLTIGFCSLKYSQDNAPFIRHVQRP